MRLYHWFLRGGLLAAKFLLRPQLDRVRCLVMYQDKILLVRHVGGSDEWSLPGGGSKPGESAVDTAHRELYEELRLGIVSARETGEARITHEYAHMRARFVMVEAESAHIHPYKWEIYEAGWFSWDRLPRPLSPFAEIAINKVKNNA